MSFGQLSIPEKPVRIQIYTGGPSILKLAYNFSKSFQDNVTFTGKPLIGVEGGFRILDWLSVGADFSYRYGELNMDINDSTNYAYIKDKWGINDTLIPNPFGHYKLEVPRFRILLQATAHVLKPDSPSDLYVQLGFGYNNVNPRLTLNNTEIQYFNKIGSFSLPVAYRLSLGYAYHFGNRVGVFGELGIGGPIFSTGLSMRF